MKVLEYSALDLKGVEKSYQKVKTMLEQGDFYSAEVKKLPPTDYYRAKLDYTNRVLFQIVSYGGEKYILILEIIHQHAYEKSKFLRGAVVNESKIMTELTELTAEPVAYINPSKTQFHLLDKTISFDDDQQEIYGLPLPLVIIGSAGSGKTALTLEKMKCCAGEILYITHSPYLVQHAHRLYYSNHYENDQQTIDFLSYQELIETIQVPSGKEMTFRDFSTWLKRLKPHKLLKDPHKIYEEFKGVITGSVVDKPFLSQSDYVNLGVKQSIYLAEDREIIYDAFTKYLNFCRENDYTDINLLSYDYLRRCQPKYDHVVIDEIQDFTPIQLLLIQKSLKHRSQFLMCGDANQIVHPNFFSWSKIKTLFYQGDLGHHEQHLRILSTNYRNSLAVTDLANQILKIKNARLGSVDRESHYLVKSQSEKPGSVFFLSAADKNTAELNQKTKQSTRYAVIVLRDDFKEAAKKYFQTPLIFSIFETKGLEYDHIILFDFISAESAPFLALTQGVTTADLQGDFTYGRAKQKTDKSLEIYKFYINALYVAITRSMQNVYWIESQEKHPLFDLLQLEQYRSALTLEAVTSSLEEWQKEARKLEMQGKQEQADAIRESLQQKTVPWEIMITEKNQPLTQKIRDNQASKAEKIQLLEYALVYRQAHILDLLAKQGFSAAQNQKKSLDLVWRKYFDPYGIVNLSPVKDQVKKYGADFRNPFNQTVLMVAATVGHAALVRWLLESGANADLTDNVGNTAFELLLQRAFTDKRFAQTKLADNYPLLAPDHLSVQADGCLIKIDQRHAEFLLMTIWVILCKTGNKPSLSDPSLSLSFPRKRESIVPAQPLDSRFRGNDTLIIFTTQDFMDVLTHFPETICPAYRKRRQYLSSILAKNEMSGKNPYNRRLFQRVRTGKYTLNPSLKIKKVNGWKEADIPRSVPSTQPNPTNPTETDTIKIEKIHCRQIQMAMQTTPEAAITHWPPTLDWQVHPTHIPRTDGCFEIALQLQLKAQHDNQLVFSIDLTQSGIFSSASLLSDPTLSDRCLTLLLPYASTQVNNLLARSGLPPITLQLQNFPSR